VNYLKSKIGITDNKWGCEGSEICSVRRLYIQTDKKNQQRVEEMLARKFPHLSTVYKVKIRCSEDKHPPIIVEMIKDLIEAVCKRLSVHLEKIKRNKYHRRRHKLA
jgi:hypothetical protein